MPDSKPVLEVRNLSVTLPKGADREFAVEKVSFTVNPGEIVCLVGESGSGKSVIAFTVMGLLAKNGSVYMLMEEEHDPRRDGQTSAFRKAAIDHLGHIMEVTGTEASHGGYKAVYVMGFVNK